MENLAFFFREDNQRSQIKGTREAHQEIIWEQFKGVQFKGVHILILSTASSLNYCYKTSHQNLQGWVQEPSVSTFVRQSNKVFLFYFTQNSVSEI